MDKKPITNKPKYYLNQEGEFVIENYNHSRPFANFFPGIAGKYGIPMWTFYVNRGQGIASFGTRDKDHAVLEFFPANKAWQLVSTYGFRTFIKVSRGSKPCLYEPFQNGLSNLEFNLANKMKISSCSLQLEELNSTLGLKVKVDYFTVPNAPYAGLCRTLTIQNTGHKKIDFELLDGLPQIVPFGTSNFFLKKLGRTIEAWMNVENMDRSVPFYKLTVDPSDRPEVIHITEGNFYLGFHQDAGRPRIIKPIVDPEHIFGAVTDFSLPREFLLSAKFNRTGKEKVASKMPCAFSYLAVSLKPKEEKCLFSVTGYARNKQALNKLVPQITATGYLERKRGENASVIARLQQNIHTKSSSREFDLYCSQTYLDNIMRGGYPEIFNTKPLPTVFYLYARKHGDLERDYNKFHLQPTYFSQGNGNYRDMNQNRRCDIWFNPRINEENIVHFLNLLQADGFNPLVVKGAYFTLKEIPILTDHIKNQGDANKIKDFLQRPFTPGELIFFIEDNDIGISVANDEFLDFILSHAEKHEDAEHGEGFWTDHWTYTIDLLESYLGVYPEKLNKTLLEERCFTFYDNTETVKPRSEKYLLRNGTVMQLHSLSPDNSKRELIRKRHVLAHAVRKDQGHGDIYYTTLINKLLCLVVNKMASFDPFGMGIEMEADKPNWYDALNGLPALFGSSLCETFELKRLLIFIKDALQKSGWDNIALSEEIHGFLIKLRDISGLNDYTYWDESHSLKEEYRHNTRLGFSGKEIEINCRELAEILTVFLKRVKQGIEKSKEEDKDLYCAYFMHEVLEYETLKDPFIRPVKFRQIRVPLFLEAQMHALRLAEDTKEARSIHKATKASALFDKKLKMYKVTAPLNSMPEEIGRCRIFTPGWLENESIWLHMEYKYILELLRQGLSEEFYADFKNVLIPFRNPKIYGRSILENSSFLVSSAFPDPSLHGNGFVARLSGSTAEFLQLWLLMNTGPSPFLLNEKKELCLKFAPILAGWLFDRKGEYSFNFLSSVKTNYRNPKRKDTFGKNAVKIRRIDFNDQDGNPVSLSSDTIPPPYAEQARAGLIKQIDILLD